MGAWSPIAPAVANGGSITAIYNAKASYGAVGDGVTDDTAAIQAAITACINGGGGIVYLAPGTYKITAALDFSALKGTNRGATLMGAGSGNIFTPAGSAGTTKINNFNAGPAITAYGTLLSGVSTPIVSLNLNGFMIENKVNIGSSNYTIDVDYCVNGGIWQDIYVYGANLGGNGIQSLNTANGGFTMKYVVCRGFNTGIGHYDASGVTSHVDTAPNSGNGIKIGCQSVDCLIHFRINKTGGNLFNSTSLISCKAVNVSDIVGSIGLDIQANGYQTFISAFHSERNAIGIQDGARGTICMAPMVTYPSGTPWLTTGSITNGSATLTVADGQFWQNGDRITVAGAGAAGATLTTTVSSGGGTTTLTLAATASTTVTNGNVGGTSAALRFLNATWAGEYRSARLDGVEYGIRYESGATGHQVSMRDDGLTVGTVTGANQAANETQIVTQFGRTGISTSAKRDEAKRQALGIIVETFDKNACVATYTTSTQSLQGIGVGLIAGEVITGIALELTNTPSSLTLAKVALYDKSGNRLAVSADQSAGWTGAAHKDIAFTAPYTVLKDDLYYLCLLVVCTGTTPTLLRTGSVSASAANASNSGARPFVGQGSQTDMPGTATFVAGQGGFWMAAY